jgi:hypothetical protein
VAGKILDKGLVVGSVVAPVWPPTGGGSAMGSEEDRKKFVQQVLKACHIAAKLRDLGARPHGVVRIDSASSVEEWAKDPDGNTRRIAQTFRECADVAESFGERLAAEGEICWGGMHSWREMVKLLELINRPKTVGFQADMAHTLLYTLGYNAEPADRIVPENFNWDPDVLDESLRRLTAALRPWTIDFHVAQNDGTVHGTGSHDKTGRHCQVNDPNGRLNIPYHAGFWLRDESGALTKAIDHICWDGCMFPNQVMLNQQTWNNILAAMVAVREAHGWSEQEAEEALPAQKPVPVITTRAPAPAARKPNLKAAEPVKVAAKAKKAKPAAKKKPVKATAKARVKLNVKAKAKHAPKKKAAKKASKAKKATRKPQRRSAPKRRKK